MFMEGKHGTSVIVFDVSKEQKSKKGFCFKIKLEVFCVALGWVISFSS